MMVDLSISNGYVPTWGVVEGVREIFQNAIDNEIETKGSNEMLFSYDKDKEVLTIGNKTSKLDSSTLLLGVTTKADNEDTIGHHGEGYKVALMVLLRAGKKVTIYNYGYREIWTAKLRKLKKYNKNKEDNNLSLGVDIKTAAIWTKIPSHDLIYEISGINEEEYNDIQFSNLYVRGLYSYSKSKEVLNENIIHTYYGDILLDEKEASRIYLKGLFVCEKAGLKYGYNLTSSNIKLDRDRRLLGDFDCFYNTSSMWSIILSNKDNINNKAIVDALSDLIYTSLKDITYVSSDTISYYLNEHKKPKSTNNIIVNDNDYSRHESSNESILVKKMMDRYHEENGEDSVPVDNNEEYEMLKEAGKKPIISSSNIAAVYKSSNEYASIVKQFKTEEPKLYDLLSEFKNKFFEDSNNVMDDDSLELLDSILLKLKEKGV